MVNLKTFFSSWVDEPDTDSFFALLIGLIAIASFAVYTNIDTPNLKDVALVYTLMILIGMTLSYVETLADVNKLRDYLLDTLGMGTSLSNAIFSIVAGIFIGILIFGIFPTMAMSHPPNQTYQSINFFFTVILAPFTETMFFFGIITPTFIKYLERWKYGGIVGVVAGAFAFSMFHFKVLNGDVTSAFIFGLISPLLMYATRSLGGSLSLHTVVNYLAYIRGG